MSRMPSAAQMLIAADFGTLCDAAIISTDMPAPLIQTSFALNVGECSFHGSRGTLVVLVGGQ